VIRNVMDSAMASGAVAAGAASAFQSGPNIEGFDVQVLDARPSGAPGIALGTLWVERFTAANTGDAFYDPSAIYAQPIPIFSYGVLTSIPPPTAPAYGQPLVNNVSSGQNQIRLRQKGTAAALCTTPAGIAIAAGTPLCADGNNNLTPFLSPAAAPTPVVTPVGAAGAVTVNYALVAVSSAGVPSALGTAGQTTTSNATLTNANYNQLSWTPVADAAYYIVVRTTAVGLAPATVGVIGYVSGEQDTFNDTGLAIIPNTSATVFFPTLSAPAQPTVAQVTGATAGTTTDTYTVVAVGANGIDSAQSTARALTTANATLTPANGNRITWTAVPGAAYYKIIRTVAGGSPSSTGLIGTSNNPTGGFLDYGQTAVTYTPQSTPMLTPANGQVLAIAKGALPAGTSAPTLVNVQVGGY
jgi:hypothetical protein